MRLNRSDIRKLIIETLLKEAEDQNVKDKSGNSFSISSEGDIFLVKNGKKTSFKGEQKRKVALNLIDDLKSMNKSIPSGLIKKAPDPDFIDANYEIVDEGSYRFKILPDGKLFLLSNRGKLINKEITGENKSKAAKTLQDLVKDKKSSYPYLFKIKTISTTSTTSATQADAGSKVSSQDMFAVVDNKGTHYRVLTDGEIFRFGITNKRGEFVMDDPSIKINPPDDKKIAGDLLKQNSRNELSRPLDTIVIKTLVSMFEGGSSNDNPIDTATNNLLRTLRKVAQSLGTKIHLVGFADYLLGRTKTFTENDLNDEYKKDLAKVAKIAVSSPYNGRILGSNDFVYKKFWPAAAKALNQKPPSPPLGPNPGPKGSGSVEDLMYFIGGMTVKKEGSNYVIEDLYDFDDYYSNPNVFSDLNTFLGSMTEGTVYQKVRKIAAWRQSSEYGGYRIKITLPTSLADA